MDKEKKVKANEMISIPVKKFISYKRSVLNELNDGINYINSHNMTWLYITSFDGLKLAARFFNNPYPVHNTRLIFLHEEDISFLILQRFHL